MTLFNEFRLAKTPRRIFLAIILGIIPLSFFLPAEWEPLRLCGYVAQMFCAGIWLAQEMRIWEKVDPSKHLDADGGVQESTRISLRGRYQIRVKPAYALVGGGIVGLLLQAYVPGAWREVRMAGTGLHLLCFGVLASQHIAIWERFPKVTPPTSQAHDA